jgi:type IV pilus assembly protein PilC
MLTPRFERISSTPSSSLPQKGARKQLSRLGERLTYSTRHSKLELARFTKQLGMFLETGIPITKALQMGLRQPWSDALRAGISRIYDAVVQGHSLSHGMSETPAIFDPLAISVISAGEISGCTAESLYHLSLRFERLHKAALETRAALIYPLCVVSIAAAVSSFLLIFIIPAFRDLFAETGALLPAPTRFVLALSEFVTGNMPLLCATLCTGALLFRRTLRTPSCKEITSRIAFAIPFIRNISTATALARTTTALATTLKAGVPILKALEISGETAGNSHFKRAMKHAALEVSEGHQLSYALRASQMFPSTMIEMLEIGETTGHLDGMLQTLAKTYEEDSERYRASLQALVEPLLIAILGIVVGGLIISLYLPIFSLGEALT